ncbi:MAG: RNA polymerase factor sigma-54 [Bacillota bacterium]|nr:RNA polymerase factor sigma-54 [Bacillota bacterium]
MDTNLHTHLNQSGEILLYPRNKNINKIIRMNAQALLGYVEEQLELNPVLELSDSDICIDECVNLFEYEEEQQEIEAADSFEGKMPKEDSLKNEDGTLENCVVQSKTIKEYLLEQLESSRLEDKDKAIGEYIIDNIDENGYLKSDAAEIAAFFDITEDNVLKVLNQIQTFDPPGICARNLKECLTIQLKQMGTSEELIEIVDTCLNELAMKKISSVARKTGTDTLNLEALYDLIKTLEPKPGREFCSVNTVRYVLADIFIREVKGGYEAILNEECFPAICLNTYYRKIALDNSYNEDARKFIYDKIDSAIALMKSLDQRRTYIKKVADFLTVKQKEFFEYGVKSIKPLNLKEASIELGLNEYILNAVITGKFLQCRWGNFELGYFFGGKEFADAGKLCAQDVKNRLLYLLKTEDRTSPYSDLMLSELLSLEGIKISRRTVTKYRNELGMGTSAVRKTEE